MKTTLEKTFPEECQDDTIKFIESKSNWDVANQRYRKPDDENCKAELTDCKIYWRGKYLIVEHDDIIHYWECEGNYCFLQEAVKHMRLDLPAKWKTLDKLISLRMAIRQTEVNWCGYVEDVLEGNRMTHSLYNYFMKLARTQDFQHHGQHTF